MTGQLAALVHFEQPDLLLVGDGPPGPFDQIGIVDIERYDDGVGGVGIDEALLERLALARPDDVGMVRIGPLEVERDDPCGSDVGGDGEEIAAPGVRASCIVVPSRSARPDVGEYPSTV